MTSHSSEYRRLVDRLHRNAVEEYVPLNGTFELTGRCNLACSMCYVRGLAERQELSAGQWLSLAREAKGNGTLFLLLTGGEPLLRPDFFKIYEPLTNMGFIITLFTNGTLITDAVAERLAQAPPGRVEITLYGATARTYEAVTGVRGSFSRCCAGVRALVARKIPLGLKTTMTRRNIGEIEGMRAMGRRWGVPFSGAWMLSRRRDGASRGAEECRLPVPECVAMEAADPVSAQERAESAFRDVPIVNESGFYCQAGKSAFVITPSGDMNACIDLPLPAARPLETGFGAAWERVRQFTEGAPPPSPVCRACDMRAYCPRCPAWSYLETGTLTEPVPYLCAIARARRERYEPQE